MSWRLVPPPTREDVAAEKLARECAGRGHSFPEVWPLDPAQVTAGPGASSQHRAPCPDCATVRVLSWQGPLPGSSTRSQGRTAIAMAMMVTYEAPEPGDVPGIADLAASVSYDEVAAARAAAVEPPHSARIGFYQDVVAVRDDSGHDDPLPAPGELTAARIELTLTVAAWQFYLLDAAEKPARILPVPEHAASAGIIDTVTGATLLWTGLRQGPVHLTVSIAPADPGADLEGYQDVAEISHRSTTGRLAIAGLAQTARGASAPSGVRRLPAALSRTGRRRGAYIRSSGRPLPAADLARPPDQAGHPPGSQPVGVVARHGPGCAGAARDSTRPLRGARAAAARRTAAASPPAAPVITAVSFAEASGCYSEAIAGSGFGPAPGGIPFTDTALNFRISDSEIRGYGSGRSMAVVVWECWRVRPPAGSDGVDEYAAGHGRHRGRYRSRDRDPPCGVTV